MITSSSIGKYIPSKLRIYKYKSKKEVKDIQTDEMMEEITVEDDKLISVFESNAKVYKTSKKSKDIVICDINKLLKKTK